MAATISNIIDVVVEDIENRQRRPLRERYSIPYLDGYYIKLRRQVVESEVVYMAVVLLCITVEGFKEIVRFYISGW